MVQSSVATGGTNQVGVAGTNAAGSGRHKARTIAIPKRTATGFFRAFFVVDDGGCFGRTKKGFGWKEKKRKEETERRTKNTHHQQHCQSQSNRIHEKQQQQQRRDQSCTFGTLFVGAFLFVANNVTSNDLHAAQFALFGFPIALVGGQLWCTEE
jgi:hypothetical protein